MRRSLNVVDKQCCRKIASGWCGDWQWQTSAQEKEKGGKTWKFGGAGGAEPFSQGFLFFLLFYLSTQLQRYILSSRAL